MSDYIKITNFTSKDSLPTGNANKIVKGTEIDNEFIAIAASLTTKADLASPVFTGAPLAPTAISGTNTTQIATTAFVKNAFDTLGTMSTQNANAVAITGGTITGVTITNITDLAVADGGTGSSTLTANAVLLGNGTSPLQTVSPGSADNLLTSNGTTWIAAAPTYTGNKSQIFTSNGTFTIPTGVTAVKVTVIGGGGSGVSNGSGGSAGGNSGGNSTVSSGTQTITTITGGGGGGGVFNGISTGGSATNGDFNIKGGSGFVFLIQALSACSFPAGQMSGTSALSPGVANSGGSLAGQFYGSGGLGSNVGAGAGGGTAIKFLTNLTPNSTLSVTIGAGGVAVVNAGYSNQGGPGAAGLVIFEW